MNAITKELSRNDIGVTGGHQAGILVPKQEEVLSFFPRLDPTIKNPRATLVVREMATGTRWSFQFIYYNGSFFGGTRNEYRLTRMTGYLRAVSAAVGDILSFTKDTDGSMLIERIRPMEEWALPADTSFIVLRGGWKVIAL